MTFPKAHAGVKKIYTATIISLTGTLVLLILSVISIIATAVFNTNSAASSVNWGTMLIPVCGTLLMLVCFILNLIGVLQAKADEPSFMIAVFFLIVSCVMNLLSLIFTYSAILSNVFSVLASVVSLAACYFIILGIRKLARKLNRDDMDRKGVVPFLFYICSTVLAVITAVFRVIVSTNPNAVLSSIYGIISPATTILSIVATIIYLVFLKKAVKMLET